MNKFIIPIICLLLSIVSFVLVTIVVGQNTYKDADNVDKCNAHDFSNGKECGIWLDNTCYKGTRSGNNCIKKGSLVGLVGIVFSIVFLIIFALTLIRALRKRK